LHANVIRLAPPMNISKADVDEAIRLLDTSLGEIRP
jgi:4-aminobutyrate aminotransferase-like enzyme